MTAALVPAVLLIPVLGRPHRVAPLLDSIARGTPERHRVLFIASPDDPDTHDAIHTAGGTALTHDGNYAAKVNAGIAATRESLIFLGADDLHFHPSWLTSAAAMLTPPVGLVGTQDLCNQRVIRGEHATHFLISRSYAEQGTVDGQPGPLCELYPHEYVDDELVCTAKRRGAWAFADKAIVEHLHPDVGKAPMDGLYAARRRRMRQGRVIFEQRRHLWET